MIACYCRVSPEDQDLDRQLEATSEYAQEQLGAGSADIDVYRDQSTGTDTARDGTGHSWTTPRRDAVVANSVSRIARSVRDPDRTAEWVTEAAAELCIVDEGLVMKPDPDEPYQNALFRLLGESPSARPSLSSSAPGRASPPGRPPGPSPGRYSSSETSLFRSPKTTASHTISSRRSMGRSTVPSP